MILWAWGVKSLASLARPTDILKKLRNTPFIQPFTYLFNYTEVDANSFISPVERQTLIQGYLVCDHDISNNTTKSNSCMPSRLEESSTTFSSCRNTIRI